MEEKYIISVETENTPGILARVSGLFARRGFNIEALTVWELDSGISKMLIITKSSEETLEQIQKQLRKLIDVITVKRIDFETLDKEIGNFSNKLKNI